MASTFRAWDKATEVGDQTPQDRRRCYPQYVYADAPNQAWTWDISRLRGPVICCWFYLYVVLDIFSRKIVAWTIDETESDQVANNSSEPLVNANTSILIS